MRIGVLKIIWKLKFWKLFENWNFENYLKIGVLKIKFERNWSFENYLRIRVLKIIWELEFWKLFENWSFENYFKIEILKIIWELKLWKLFWYSHGWCFIFHGTIKNPIYFSHEKPFCIRVRSLMSVAYLHINHGIASIQHTNRSKTSYTAKKHNVTQLIQQKKEMKTRTIFSSKMKPIQQLPP